MDEDGSFEIEKTEEFVVEMDGRLVRVVCQQIVTSTVLDLV